MPIDLQESCQPPKCLGMTSEVQKHMMRHAGMDEPIKTWRHWLPFHLNKQTVARHPTFRWNCPAFKSGHVVAIVASPKSRDRDGLISLKQAIYDEGSRDIEVLSKSPPVLASDR